jgi:hypothetical protein
MKLVEATELSLVGGAIRYDEPSDCVWIVNPAKPEGWEHELSGSLRTCW